MILQNEIPEESKVRTATYQEPHLFFDHRDLDDRSIFSAMMN